MFVRVGPIKTTNDTPAGGWTHIPVQRLASAVRVAKQVLYKSAEQITKKPQKKPKTKPELKIHFMFMFTLFIWFNVCMQIIQETEREREEKTPQTLPLNILLPFCRYPCTNINNRRVHGYIDIKKLMTKLERLLSGHDVVCRRVYPENRTGEYSLRFEQIVSCTELYPVVTKTKQKANKQMYICVFQPRFQVQKK